MLFLNIINHIVRQNPEVRQQLSGYNGLVVGVRTGSLHIVGRINAEGLLAHTHRAAVCTLLHHQDALPQMMQGRMPDFNDVAIEGDMPLGMGILWRCAALRYSHIFSPKWQLFSAWQSDYKRHNSAMGGTCRRRVADGGAVVAAICRPDGRKAACTCMAAAVGRVPAGN